MANYSRNTPLVDRGTVAQNLDENEIMKYLFEQQSSGMSDIFKEMKDNFTIKKDENCKDVEIKSF
jgi:hypothetical protein